jgi:hypothetical protein
MGAGGLAGQRARYAVRRLSGSNSIHVDYDHQWQLWYGAPGRVTKRVAIDARGIPEEERVGGHGMDIEMKLFPTEPGKDYSVLQDPMSIARYVDPTGNIEWDVVMVERMKRLIEPLLPDHCRCRPGKEAGT